MPHSRAKTEPQKAKKRKKKSQKASVDEREWPPKVPGAVSWAPEHLFLMPWHRQLRFLEPAAAQALRERMEVEFPGFGSSRGLSVGL